MEFQSTSKDEPFQFLKKLHIVQLLLQKILKQMSYFPIHFGVNFKFPFYTATAHTGRLGGKNAGLWPETLFPPFHA